MMKAITAMSLFSGCEGASMALSELNVPVKKMYTSEIDKFACKAAALLFPDATTLGDMTKWDTWEDEKGVNFAEIDILFAGFPCQAWSMAGKQQGDDDPRGALVHDLLDIWGYIKALNPNVKFLFENVAMKKEFMNYINDLFKVEPVLINAALVTAQNRKRNYWTNWEVSQPEDKGILLKDIIEGGTIDATIMTDTFSDRQKGRKCLVDEPKDKAVNLCANEYLKNGRQGDYIQCDEQGNQTVFRPCELREPLPFTDWSKNLNHGTREFEFEDIAEAKYALYCDDWYNKKSLCHHVATATDINANESNKRIYADSGKSPTLTTMGGGHREPKVLVGRVVGRKINPETGKRDDYNPDLKIEQRLEARPDEKSGCITTVQKDNVLIIDHPKYRKLTPKECMRLQGFPTWCIDKLEASDISNSQKYKMTGNGWAIPVITHILQELIDTGWMKED